MLQAIAESGTLFLSSVWTAGYFAPPTRGLIVLQDCGQGKDERVATLAKFVQPLVDDTFQGVPPTGEQNHTDLPVIPSARRPADITPRREPVDQTHSAVMPEKKALGEAADAGLLWVRESADGQQHLVLLRLEAGGFRRLIASAQELADSVAQSRQRGVFGLAYFSCHV